MTLTHWLGMSLTALLLGAAARAEEPRLAYSAPVTVPEAEVRSGPGNTPEMYVTSRLHKGDKVEVVKELEGGWLAIKPPAGSFSWINTRFIQQITPGRPMWVVVAHPDTKVPLLMGSVLKADKPTVESIRVGRGQQLRSLGAMKLGDDGYWLPVEPASTEVRYLRADALARKTIETTSAAPPVGAPEIPAGPFAPPGAPGVEPPAAAPPGAPAGVHPLWQRAAQAEREGHYDEAVRLYRQLGIEVASTDHPLSLQASNQAQRLTDALQGRPPSAPIRPDVNAPTSPSTLPAGWTRSGGGWLRRAGPGNGVAPLFVLESSQGLPILYAVAQSGFTLAPYENRNVELMGVRQYRGDLRAYQMTVMQVQPLR